MASETIRIPEQMKRPLVIGKTTFCSAYDFTIKDTDLIKAQQELKEEEHKQIEYLKELKAKLTEDEQLIFRPDDEFLLRYLRFKKFDLEKAYKALCRFYSMRKSYPDCFILKYNKLSFINDFIKYLPYREEGGPLLAMTDLRKLNLQEISYLDVMQLITMANDIMTMNPHLQIHGLLSIWDFRGVTVKHLIHALHPSTFLPLSSFLQDFYPWRLKKGLLIHCNRQVLRLYSFVKPILKKKIKERIHLLGSDMTELHKFVNPALLPKEYGGTLEEPVCKLADVVSDNFPYLEYERTFGYKSG